MKKRPFAMIWPLMFLIFIFQGGCGDISPAQENSYLADDKVSLAMEKADRKDYLGAREDLAAALALSPGHLEATNAMSWIEQLIGEDRGAGNGIDTVAKNEEAAMDSGDTSEASWFEDTEEEGGFYDDFGAFDRERILAAKLLWEGAYADAQALLDELLESSPDDVHLLSMATLAANGEGDLELATDLALDAYLINPASPELQNNLAYSLAEEAVDLDEALELANSALDGQPSNPAFMDTMGWVLYKLGDAESALEYFSDALENTPDGPSREEILFHYEEAMFFLDS